MLSASGFTTARRSGDDARSDDDVAGGGGDGGGGGGGGGDRVSDGGAPFTAVVRRLALGELRAPALPFTTSACGLCGL